MKTLHIKHIVAFIYKFLLVIIGFCIFYLLFQSINSGGYSVYAIPLNPKILLIGAFIYLGILFLISYIIKFLSNTTILTLSIIILVGILIGLIFGGSFFRFSYTYDIDYLHTTAWEIAIGKGKLSTLWYLERYPHQLNPAQFLSVFYTIGNFFGIKNYLQLGYFISYIFIWLSALFAWLSIKKMLNNQYAFIFLIAFLLNPIFYMYASYCYTDILCMPFIYGMIYILTIENKITVFSKSNYLLLILSGFIGCCGFFMRATNGIPVIAVLIFLILKKSNHKFNKIVSFTFGLCIAFSLWSGINHITDSGLNPEAKYPLEHWIAMGTDATNNGRYSVDAERFTHSFDTYNDKVLNGRDKIHEHISNIGFKGMGSLILTKLTILWTDGTNNMRAYFHEKSYLGNLNKYVIGDKRVLVRYFYQFVRIALFMGMIIGLIFEFKKTELNEESTLWISFFGVCLFYAFWEVMNRYSIPFIPMLIMLQAIGIGRIMGYKSHPPIA